VSGFLGKLTLTDLNRRIAKTKGSAETPDRYIDRSRERSMIRRRLAGSLFKLSVGFGRSSRL